MLRIISGQFRGRQLALPPASLSRPSSQRTREAVFNILMHDPEKPLRHANVLDLFAGSGALGLEALSHGAAHVSFVESNAEVLKTLRQNIEKLGVQDHTTVLAMDVQKLLRALNPVDLVFLDPPYGKNLEIKALQLLQQQGWLKPTTLIILETSAKQTLEPPEAFIRKDERIYGAAKVSFLKIAER